MHLGARQKIQQMEKIWHFPLGILNAFFDILSHSILDYTTLFLYPSYIMYMGGTNAITHDGVRTTYHIIIYTNE